MVHALPGGDHGVEWGKSQSNESKNSKGLSHKFRSPSMNVFARGQWNTGRATKSLEPGATGLKRLVQLPIFVVGIDVIIVFNFVFLTYETDLRAKERQGHLKVPNWVDTVNSMFLIVYTVELVLRLLAERKQFFSTSWNNCDLVVVVVGLLGQFLDGLSKSVIILRIFRLLRLLRVVRLLGACKELWSLLRGLLGCVKTLFWASILMLVSLTIWSIYAVEVLHPLMEDIAKDGVWESCNWCENAFSSVMDSNITIFQIASGDGWSTLARPIVRKHPWTLAVFSAIIFTMMLGMMNLVTAVIIDNQASAREVDIAMLADEKKQLQEQAKDRLISLCKELDHDKIGRVSLEELKDGCIDDRTELNHMLFLMDIDKEEIDVIFDILDENRLGTISPEEFGNSLWKLKFQDLRTTLHFVKKHVLNLEPGLNQIRETQAGHGFAHSQALYNLADAVRDILPEVLGLAAPLEAAAKGSRAHRDSSPDDKAMFAKSLPSHATSEEREALCNNVVAENGGCSNGHEVVKVHISQADLQEFSELTVLNGRVHNGVNPVEVTRPLKTPPKKKRSRSNSREKRNESSAVDLVAAALSEAEMVLVAPSCSTPRAAREAVAGPQRRWRPPAEDSNGTQTDADHSDKSAPKPKQRHPHVLPMRPAPTPKVQAKGCDLLGGNECLGGCPGSAGWKEPPHKHLNPDTR